MVCRMVRNMNYSKTKLVLLGVLLTLFALLITLLAGYFGVVIPSIYLPHKDGVVLTGVSPKIVSDADPRISDLLLNEIDASSIRQYLKDYASHPHLAGTPADLEQAEQLKKTWLDQGLDRVDIVGYDVLLSYPEEEDPNIISLILDGKTIFESQREEKILRPEDIHPGDNIVPPFNAYSPPGEVITNKLIYVNYGREEDFYWLQSNQSVNFTGSIVLARHGQVFRGDKVKLAAKYGAQAMILYSDPFDYASPTANTSYPDSWWLPGTGVQRGTVKLVNGDPTTYLYPSLDSAYKVDPENSPHLPRIPVHPISYNDAKNLLVHLGGEEVPDSWRGSISGVTYRFGGEFADNKLQVKAHITTHHERRKTYNVIGYIDGAVEPDRYVVVGNHRDAWVYGAVDPNSGTAAMLEASRAITSVMKSADWRPRRTILFCSWGAEEYGIVGSVEFTENFAKILGQRAVAYLNVDLLLEGTDFMRFRATPMLYSIVIKASKKIPNPNPAEVEAGRPTVFDTWFHFFPSNDPKMPKMMPIGSASDYASFVDVLGIPSLEPRYTWDRKKWRLSSYPLYHSEYETFYSMDSIMDPGFKYSKAVTQVWAELVRDISDSMILPLDAKPLSDYIATEGGKIIDVNGDLMRANNLTADIGYFQDAIELLNTETRNFLDRLSDLNKMNPYAVREVNDKLMNLHRSFLDPQGLPGRQHVKNLLSAPSQFNWYTATAFPGITDSLHRIETSTDLEKWEKVRKNMSIATYLIQSAASTLRKASEFTKS